VLDLARRLAERIGPDAEAYLGRALGIALYMRGRYREALEKLDAAVSATPGAAGNTSARLFGVYACFFLGRLREEARRARRLLRDVEDRGDVYTAVSLQTTVMADIRLMADDPEAAKRNLGEALTRWTQSGFNVQHWYAMWAETNVALYSGDGEGAWTRLARDAHALRKSFLLHSQLIRGFTAYLRACCAIASIDASPKVRVARVAEARRMARRLGKETAAWGPTLTAIVRAALANAAGERSVAVASLREALRHAEAADLALHGWAVRYQLGTAIGGDEGRDHVLQAERAMTDEGVRAPARVAALLVPGRWS
jgi:tetratricopeptide (TPR) repeat protein